MPIAEALETLSGWVARIAERRYALACLVMFAFSVAWMGLGTIPHDEYRLVAQNPFVSLRDIGGAEVNNYFQQSPMLPLVGYGTHLTSKPAFFALCLGLIIAAFAAFAALARARYGREAGLVAVALALAHPVTLVMLSWIGTPDGVAFGLMACVLFARSGILIAALCAVGAFNHPIIVFAAPVVILLRAASGEKECGFAKLAWAAAGFAVGTGAVYAFNGYYHISIFSRLDCIGTRTAGGWIAMNLAHLPLTLWSLHGAVWLALAAAAAVAWSLDRRYFLVFIACQVFLYAVTFCTEDTTRVFSLLSWAAAAHCVMHAARLLEAKGLVRERAQYLGALAAIALFGLVGPRVYMWAGSPHASNFGEFWRFMGRWVV